MTETAVRSTRASKGLLRLGLLAVAVLLTAFLGYGVWQAGQREQERAANPTTPVTNASMQLSAMDYTEMENERRVWTLHSDTAAYYQDEQKSVLSNVRMVFFFEDGREIRLTSSRGALFLDSKNVELWGLVEVEMPEGYTLKTEQIHYGHQQQLVTSNTPTTLEGPDLSLTGERFEYHLADQRGALNGGVRAIVEPSRLQPRSGS